MQRLRPVILTIFANNQDAYLDQLEAEQQAIDNALFPLDDLGFIKLHKENFTSSRRLVDLCIRYHGRIIGFHFAGHSNGNKLDLTDGGGYKKGLAELLQGIPFVFINGCASLGQVDTLLKNGVKSIIATSTAINDTKASEFSTMFYAMFAKNQSIIEAFKKAKQGLITKYGKKAPNTTIQRGLILKRDDATTFEWGLYSLNEHSSQWQLPNQFYQSALEQFLSSTTENIKKSNRHLVKKLYYAIRETTIAKRIRLERKTFQPNPNYSEGVQVISESFLAPISEELRRLFTKECSSFDVKRLQQIIKVYDRTIELVAFIMLSNLWSNIEHIQLTKENKNYLQAFFNLDHTNFPYFDYFDFTKFLVKLFNTNNFTPFISEMSHLNFDPSTTLTKSATFLSELKELLPTIKATLINKVSQQAEIQLTNFLKEMRFLVKYHLIVVKSIHIHQLKKQAPEYWHDIVILDNNKNNIEPDRSQKITPHTDSEAVILFKDKANIGLNLTPFVIDENAINKEANSRIHYFSHINTLQKYCYLSIVDYKILEIKKQTKEEFEDTESNSYKNIIQLFENAKNEILAIKKTPVPPKQEDMEWDDE